MGLPDLFHEPAHQRERAQLPLLVELCERYRNERPFENLTVVFSHLLVRNSMVVAEGLAAGGAEVIFADAFPSPADAGVRSDLIRHGVRVLPVEQAVQLGNHYLDVSAVLGRARLPAAAAEVTRTGVHFYRDSDCPVVSADDSRSKLIEGFFGTGDSFLRAWKTLRPASRLAGKHVIQFGFGKIGRGIAWRAREAGVQVTVAEVDAAAAERAAQDGFQVLSAAPNKDLRRALSEADIVISVTGIPGIIGKSLPAEWLRAGSPVLVNLGAMDEFGPQFEEREILGGRSIPLNFHLPVPTWNRYIDPPLAAHLLALEAHVTRPGQLGPGVHPLPPEMDEWIIETWRSYWPDEDLRGIATQLGLDSEASSAAPV